MRKKILPTLLFIMFFRFAPAATAMEIFKSEFVPFLPDSIRDKAAYLRYTVSHQELLRSTRNDTVLSRYSLRQQELKFYFPSGNMEVAGIIRRSVPNMDDLFNSEYTSAAFRPLHYFFGLSPSFSFSDWQIIPDLAYAFSAFSDTVRVLKYPRSEKAAYNNYFFNLLPETFGDTLPYQYQLHHWQAGLQARKNSPFGPFFLSYRYKASRNMLTESHVNTGPYPKLAGPRESRILLGSDRHILSAAWQAGNFSLLSLEYRFTRIPLDWRHRIFPDTPDTLEIVKLAEASVKNQDFRAAFRYQNKSFQIETHAGGAFFRGDLFVSTPVLGYLFRILPISHQGTAEADISYGYLYSNAAYAFEAGPLCFRPRLDLYAARFYSKLMLDAQLEFGLEDIQFEQNYIHALYLIVPSLYGEIPLNRELLLYLNAEQVLPFFRTVYPEPEPQPPSDIRRYGGLSVEAGIAFRW
ncbi:MAG: hypothetical protein PHX07_00805 [Candidatus Marinimicrobia bacterium]|jgi:hypothetical protein|nr:hypothetical protein [Candidatus Neomarinimicrobiota bacterium]MDD4960755.1 hypothetical protein [Candidatus Neomarinimicrobiota bacterium]MDD5708902.1 hypothetical protein [Candidatus Neomarinimicrobiota bacterium]MDX9777748.1 hypothetical protein [bacterium]